MMNRRSRRVLVTAFYLCTIWFIFTLDSSFGVGLHLALLGISLLLFVVLLVATNTLAFRAGRNLDERQVLVSLKANQTGLLVGSTVVITIFLFELVAWQPFALRPSVSLSAEDILLITSIFICLPTMLIAWKEDPIQDELDVIHG